MTSTEALPSPALYMEPECTSKCRSVVHASLINNAITKGSSEQIVSYMKKLCQNYAHVTDEAGRNALHFAASCGKWQVIRWLLQHEHCDCNFRDRESGWTALHRSLFYGQLGCAKLLLQFGASLSLYDHDYLSPLDLVMKDRPAYVCYRTSGLYEVYVWGTNQNYNLGLGIQHSKKNPEFVDTFRKENISVVQVVVCKYHTVFLSQAGKVFTCGHGQGGRLGHAVEHTVLMPQLLKSISKEVCVQIAAGKDHNIILMESGSVWTWGSNNCHQLGHMPAPEKLLMPKMITGYKFLKGIKIIGVAAASFHSVIYTEDAIFTFGLNAGQLGSSAVGDKWQTSPKIVSALANQNIRFTHVVASDGATICVTKQGDIFVLHEYKCRKIASKKMDIVKVVAIGGKLEAKVDSSILKDDSGMELRVLLLLQCGRIYLWSESSPQVTYCFFSISRHLHVTDVGLFKNPEHELVLLTSDGEGFIGSITPPKIKAKKSEEAHQLLSSYKAVRSFTSWIDKDESFCIKLKRLSNIHRATAVACDHKGQNFAVLQAHPQSNVYEVPEIAPSEMPGQMRELLKVADLYDDIHDAVIKVGQRSFPVHRYVLASRWEAFRERLHESVKLVNENDCLSIMESNVHPDTMEQILQFLYTDECTLLAAGYPNGASLETNLHWRTRATCLPPDIVTSVLESGTSDLQCFGESECQSAVKITNSNSTPKASKAVKKQTSKEKPTKIIERQLKLLKDAAKKLNIRNLEKSLEKVDVFDGGVRINSLQNRGVLKFDRKNFVQFCDATIKSADGKEFQCHKCILVARSDYFRGMFSNKWRETSSVLALPIPGDILKITIDYLYTDNTTKLLEIEEVEFLCNVMVTADQMLLTRLKELCEVRLTELLTLKNACELLELSMIYDASQLKTTCMNFINLNLCAILEARTLDILSDETLVELTKSYRNMISQMSYRAVTPFPGHPSLDFLQRVAEYYPVNFEDDESIESQSIITPFKEGKKLKNKRKSHNSKMGDALKEQQICKSKIHSVKELEDRAELDSDIYGSTISISASTQKMEDAFESMEEPLTSRSPSQLSCLESPPMTSPKWLGTYEDMTAAFPDLLNDVEQIPENNRGKQSSAFHRIPKMSQKQRKKMFGGSVAPLPIPHTLSLAVSPPSPKQWNAASREPTSISLKDIIDSEIMRSTQKYSVSSVSSTDSPSVAEETHNVWINRKSNAPTSSVLPCFSDILQTEQEQFQNFAKLKTKPLHLIQVEDQAIEELLKFYDSSEEHVTVDRISPNAAVTPVWKVPGKQTGWKN